MEPFQAVVKNGRLVLDQPTSLPDGEVVMLISIEDLLGAADAHGGVVALPVPSSAPPPRRRKARVDAAALIAELRSI